MNYSWEILSLDTANQTNSDGVLLENAVVKIQWKKIATDDNGNTASYFGKTEMSAVNVVQNEFIAFQTLTKEKVIEWIESNSTERELKLVEEALERRLLKNKTTNRSVPWSVV